MSTLAVDPLAAAPQALPAEPTIQPPAAPQAPQTNWFDDPSLSDGPQAELQQPQSQFFVEAPEGDVRYKTSADVIQASREASRVIWEQRQQLAQAQALLAAQGIRVGPQAPARPDLLYALRDAVSRGDITFDQAIKEAVRQQVVESSRQQYDAVMAPLLPLVEHANESWGLQEAARQFDPNIPAFVKSPAFAKVMSQLPTLAGGIQAARRDPQMRAALPEMYLIAYRFAEATMRAPASSSPQQRTAPASTVPPLTLTFPLQTALTTQPIPNLYGGNTDPFQTALDAIPNNIVDLMTQEGGRSF